MNPSNPSSAGWPTDMDPDRHYGILRLAVGSAEPAIRPEIRCGSKADVAVFPIYGNLILSSQEGGAASQTGPHFVQCAEHGDYLAFVQVLERGGGAASMPIVLIPLSNVEYIQPIGMQ